MYIVKCAWHFAILEYSGLFLHSYNYRFCIFWTFLMSLCWDIILQLLLPHSMSICGVVLWIIGKFNEVWKLIDSPNFNFKSNALRFFVLSFCIMNSNSEICSYQYAKINILVYALCFCLGVGLFFCRRDQFLLLKHLASQVVWHWINHLLHSGKFLRV